MHARRRRGVADPTAYTADAPRPTSASAVALPARPDAPTRRLPLGTFVHARSGDKGGDANIGLWVAHDRRPTRSTNDARCAWLFKLMSPAGIRTPAARGPPPTSTSTSACCPPAARSTSCRTALLGQGWPLHPVRPAGQGARGVGSRSRSVAIEESPMRPRGRPPGDSRRSSPRGRAAPPGVGGRRRDPARAAPHGRRPRPDRRRVPGRSAAAAATCSTRRAAGGDVRRRCVERPDGGALHGGIALPHIAASGRRPRHRFVRPTLRRPDRLARDHRARRRVRRRAHHDPGGAGAGSDGDHYVVNGARPSSPPASAPTS